MPMVEIEDAVLSRYKSFEEMFDKIGKGKNRQKLLALVKEDFPDIPIPEIDAAVPLREEAAALRAELGTIREQIAKEKADREEQEARRTASRSIAESRRGLRDGTLSPDGISWDDEGIEKIEAYMRESGNPDYKSAAAYVRSQLPVTSDNMPTTFAGQSWNWFRPEDGDEDHKLLAKGPTGARQFQERIIGRWKQDMRRQQGRVA